ncbi:hypothetical protein M413DRAFT_30062 [Hebeloma cylindrosporum]|uniref:F-box domain-containing protein n=1 Tax=Hebeloma cylindrosporum TaxID=76867 RepID=A0A0C3C2K6_HEBCY|nr:hypothetical protein M413DRAFT_30062 [Hebeloma cylindrosporum h7]
MGGSDTYCSVSGARYFYGAEEFFDELSSLNDALLKADVKDLWPGARQDLERMPRESFSARLQRFAKDLQYSQEDVDSSCRFVLFCSLETREDGTIVFDELDRPEIIAPSKYTESTKMTEIFNIGPGDDPELGDYQDLDRRSFSTVSVDSVIVAYTSYLILKQAAPEVNPRILHNLVSGGYPYTNGEIEGIDYGPVGRTIEQYVYWTAICEGGSLYHHPTQIKFWHQLLSNKERADEDIVHDAWKGPGNMWVFVRPDRFPIKETLAAKPIPKFPYLTTAELDFQNHRSTLGCLPPDMLLEICELLPIRSIYALITTCKKIRSVILPHANPIARRRLIEDEPWYLPAGPFELPASPFEKTPRLEMHGREEIEWWAAQWAAGGISQEDADVKIPWFAYRKECSKSMSMWNRKRIWGICKQLDALARKKGLL